MKKPVVPPETLAQQAIASDPSNSAWVSANAGSGKTHVLAQRVIRLLLDGTDPAKILCLTYTRAAASNMAGRIFNNLAQWTMMPDAALGERIAALEGRPPPPAKVREARRLFARALDTPGGLKIQTIHAFCEAILHQFPLEANIAGHFELMDGAMEAALVAEARREMIGGAAEGANRELAEAFATVLQVGRESGLDQLLDEIVRRRAGLRGFIDQIEGGEEKRFQALFDEFGFSQADSAASIAGGAWPLPGLSAVQFSQLVATAEKVGANAVLTNIVPDTAAAFRQADAVRRLDLLVKGLLKTDGEPYDIERTFRRSLREQIPDIGDRYQEAAAAARRTRDRLALYRTLEATRAALIIADWLIARYERAKAARGLLDFNDLIARTVRLLSRRDAGAWVQYKLDRGIDHILVDEAQDTSTDQWRVIRLLAEEFFSGLGARPDVLRTVFAVGDEKQSIYSFQGAEPDEFDHGGRAFERRSAAVDRRFERVRLRHSFRSTEDVLSAVDLVFDREDVRDGLTSDPEPIRHSAIRAGEAGYVELWPSLGEDAVEEPADWRVAVDHASAPAVRVAEEIAAAVTGWVRGGEIIEGRGRRLAPGDVMVLVRKRDRFVHALARGLKNRGVPVAGADRLRLQDHIAVKDLIALGRFVLQPHDDLSLAALLKSPVFGLTEDGLFGLAAGRPKGRSLFEALRAQAADDAALAKIAGQLLAWRDEVDFKPVFEFYAAVLGRDGVRARMIARLGREAGEILDEFLNFCLAFERVGPPGLEAFLATIESAGPEIKREMDQTRDEIRIMTVHAAKGLEAPVVFLVDGGSAPFSASHLPRLMPFASTKDGWRGNGFLWRASADMNNPALAALSSRETTRAEQEYRRLLYVGMTRAEDRLIVCGYHGRRAPLPSTWHSIVRDALAGKACQGPGTMANGEAVLRYRVSDVPARLDETAGKPASAPELAPLPDSLLSPLPPAENLPRPLSPSRASVLIEDEADTPQPGLSPVLADAAKPAFAIERGTAIHRLLQSLPDLPHAARAAAAGRFLDRAGRNWSEAERAETWRAVDAILSDQRFAPLFAAGSRAEVSLMGTAMVRGRKRAVSGKLDRLCVSGDRVLIVDYKANRTPPASVAGAAPAYILQLALYRALLAGLYPEARVDAALLFTQTPALMEVPAAVMDDALARLALP